MPNLSPKAIEAGARAMEPHSFEIFDRGYTAINYLEERAFLNAEKNVKRARKKATACLTAALETDGMVMVPKEPTEEIVNAALDVHARITPSESPFGPNGYFAALYRAMIAAAPNAPATAHIFKTGDRVRHIGRAEEGTVTVLPNGNVQVLFDRPTTRGCKSFGEYDANWFKQNPDVLVLIAATPPAGGTDAQS